jgi:hypothetical protein
MSDDGGVIHGLLRGFERPVRCVLLDVGEFRLVELVDGERAVEYSEKVQEALDQAFYRVSDARDQFHASVCVWSLCVCARWWSGWSVCCECCCRTTRLQDR